MKRMIYFILTAFMALALLSGCSTLEGITGGSGSSSSSGAPKQKSDAGLYAQVPAAAKADVKEAEFDLKQAKADFSRATQKLELAKMQQEQADLKVEYAKLGEEIAESEIDAAQLEIEIRQWEAIDNSGLGDKEDNINKIAKLKSKKLNLESKLVRTKADYATTGVKIKKLDKSIKKQLAKVNK